MNSHISRILAELVRLNEAHPDWQLLAFGSSASAEQYRKLYRLTLQYLPEGSAILDWGAGHGHFSYFLVNSGFKVSAYAFEDCSLAPMLSTSGSFQFKCADRAEPSKLPYPDCTFDAVSSIGVLEHVRETGGVEMESLRELNRVLKPGGRLLCYHLPNRSSYIEQLAELFKKSYFHPYRYSQSDVRAMLEASGFKLMTIQKYGALPRNVIGKMPGAIRKSAAFGQMYNLLDRLFEFPLYPFLQNYLFVAEKPASRTAALPVDRAFEDPNKKESFSRPERSHPSAVGADENSTVRPVSQEGSSEVRV